MKSKQVGFTLIELVVVITILGILAAVAIPRFVDLQGSARLSKMQGALGAAKSAAALAHSAAIVNSAYPNEGTVAMEGMNIDIVNHYPAATTSGPNQHGLADAAQLSATDYTILENASATPPTVTFQPLSAPNKANCSFTYSQPTATGTAPTFSALNTSGC